RRVVPPAAARVQAIARTGTARPTGPLARSASPSEIARTATREVVIPRPSEKAKAVIAPMIAASRIASAVAAVPSTKRSGDVARAAIAQSPARPEKSRRPAAYVAAQAEAAATADQNLAAHADGPKTWKAAIISQ